MASAWAAWLAAQGIAPGDRCAILAHNDAHWCAAYLGILKRGAVAVPLDTNYSAAQVATIVRDSGAKMLFVSEKLQSERRRLQAFRLREPAPGTQPNDALGTAWNPWNPWNRLRRP